MPNFAQIRAIVTDIEGTTSSIAFVKDVLFPYAKTHLPAFVRANAQLSEVRSALDDVAEITQTTLTDEAAIDVLMGWIDEDKKLTPLKQLQGLLWETGYRQQDYFGHIYADAYTQLKQWHAKGIPLYVYSSGSVFAQKLLFGHTEYGDLTPLLSGYFDTKIGMKQQVSSYQHIVATLALPAEQILFLSDIVAELDAAQDAGMQTCQLVRDNQDLTRLTHCVAPDFYQIKV